MATHVPPDTIEVLRTVHDTLWAAVHDTTVRVAEPHLEKDWWATYGTDFWRFVGQLVAAGLAILGGYLAQQYRFGLDRDRLDDHIRHRVALASGKISEALAELFAGVKTIKGYEAAKIQAVKDMLFRFEDVLADLPDMNSRIEATKVITWYEFARRLPDEVDRYETLFSEQRGLAGQQARGQLSPVQESRLDHVNKLIENIDARLKRVVDGGEEMGLWYHIYDDPRTNALVQVATPGPRPPTRGQL